MSGAEGFASGEKQTAWRHFPHTLKSPKYKEDSAVVVERRQTTCQSDSRSWGIINVHTHGDVFAGTSTARLGHLDLYQDSRKSLCNKMDYLRGETGR